MVRNEAFGKGEVRRAASVAVGVCGLWGLERLCHLILQWVELRFPSSVAGMLTSFVCLLALRAINPAAATGLETALTPARSFLTRWMALFFVPPLVQLPLNVMPGFWDFWACIVVVGGGFCATLAVTAWVASRGTATLINSQPNTSSANAWTRRSLVRLWLGVVALGLAALLVGLSEAVLVIGIGAAVLGFVFAEMSRVWLVARRLEPVALVLHPVVASACLACATWLALGQPLRTYLYHGANATFMSPGNCLMALLAPAVVALGLILAAERDLLRANVRPLLAATTVGALSSLFMSAVLSRVFHLSELYARALLPRAVTTPVALIIAEMFDGDPGLTAVFVVSSGVLGALFAAPLLRRLGFDAAFVRGVATGVSSHGIGTAALVRDNPQAAAFSAISFALVAALSVTFVSFVPVQTALEWLLVR